MNRATSVHWNEEESKVYIKINHDEPEQMKADIYNGNGKRVLNVFDRFCEPGEFKTVKKIKNIEKGFYIMKINSKEGQSIIRFKVH